MLTYNQTLTNEKYKTKMWVDTYYEKNLRLIKKKEEHLKPRKTNLLSIPNLERWSNIAFTKQKHENLKVHRSATFHTFHPSSSNNLENRLRTRKIFTNHSRITFQLQTFMTINSNIFYSHDNNYKFHIKIFVDTQIRIETSCVPLDSCRKYHQKQHVHDIL